MITNNSPCNNTQIIMIETTNFISKISTQIHTFDIFLALFGLFIYYCIHDRLTNKGPMLWPILGITPSFVLHYHGIHDWNINALRICGGSYRVRTIIGGFKGIITTNPINIDYILKTNFKNFPKGKYYRESFRVLLGDGIFNSDDEEWKKQRRIATSEMHTSRFVQFSLKTMKDLVHGKLLKVIEEQVNNSSKEHTIDLQELLLRFAFENISLVAFGVDPGCLAPGLPEIPVAKAFEEATEYIVFRFLSQPIIWKTMRFFNISKEKRLNKVVKIVHEFTETTVKNRKADLTLNQNDPCDLLSRLIKIQQRQIHANLHGGKTSSYTNNNNNFDDKFLRDFCTSFILAGRDTSSVALAWFFWLLHENPSVEKKILEEINGILRQRNDNNSSNEIIFESKELDKMTYLQAALTESLRLYPSVPIDFKQAKEDDILPDGMSIKEGDSVLYHIYAVGRTESIWGTDCLEFKPERWLKDGQFVAENQVNYLAFNAGPRLCIGKKFAYAQMKMVAASILLRYKVKVVSDQIIVPKITTTLYMKHGLLVTFEPRHII